MRRVPCRLLWAYTVKDAHETAFFAAFAKFYDAAEDDTRGIVNTDMGKSYASSWYVWVEEGCYDARASERTSSAGRYGWISGLGISRS
jgi:hypothetical protein